MKNISFIYASFLALLIAGCGNQKSTETSNEESTETSTVIVTQEQFNSSGFALGNMQKQTFPNMVETSGMIDVPPSNKAIITAFMGGFVKRTPLLVGDRVKKGQPLITLESQEFVKMQQEYLEVFNQLDFLKAEYDRNKTLFEEKIASQKNYLEAKSNYETFLAKSEGLRKQLQMLNISPKNVEQRIITPEAVIYSPIDGSITKMHVSTGSYVSPSMEILEIVDNEHVHLELTVFEKDILKIKKGQEIQFKIPEASEETFGAEVYLVGTSIEDAQRTIKVHGHLEKEDGGFLPGMFVDAKIMTDTTKAWGLPEEAVFNVEGSSYLLKLISKEGGDLQFERVGVTLGDSYAGHVEITSQEKLNDNDQFLVKGVYDLFGN